jgi:hypothetical protein
LTDEEKRAMVNSLSAELTRQINAVDCIKAYLVNFKDVANHIKTVYPPEIAYSAIAALWPILAPTEITLDI